MPFTDTWRYPEFDEPYREAWPGDLQVAPCDAYEMLHGIYCVREAAVAIIATVGEYTVEQMWAGTPTQRGTTVMGEKVLTGLRGVRILMAPRIAVSRYLVSVGQHHPLTLSSIEGMFGGDDDGVRAIMRLDDQDGPVGAMAAINASDLRKLHADAARLVKQQWPAILGLAQALADARGHRQAPALTEVITAALRTTIGQPR